jgi:hypothetical protein
MGQLVNRAAGRALIILAAAGLLLAFGGFTPIYYVLLKVPGFDLFRAPARWVVLFAFAGSLLSGVGLDAVRDRTIDLKFLLLPIAFVVCLIALTFISANLTPPGASGPLATPDARSLLLWLGAGVLTIILLFAPRSLPLAPCLLLLACLELFIATRSLTYNSRATAPEALTSLRPAITRLMVGAEDHVPPDRFLSISNIFFDPGDTAELKSIFGDQLSDDAFYDLIVATKAKEIVAPNLPLYYRLPAVDGYDGGVLPLRNYIEFQRLFLDPNLIQPDGRLREQLKSIPAPRWLNLMNTRYIVTDKVGDQWYDGVLYDLQFMTRLGSNDAAFTDQLPHFKADALGIVYSEPVGDHALARIDVAFDDGVTQTLMLIDQPITTTNTLSVVRLTWNEPRFMRSLRMTGIDGVTIHGVALIDQSSGTFQSFVLAPPGRFRLAHSGDVKIYENVDARPRAFVVNDAHVAANDDEAIRMMQDTQFDPSQSVVLIGDQGAGGRGQGAGNGDQGSGIRDQANSPAHLVAYEPEHITIDVTAQQDAYLVLTDAYYPGWSATIDGQPAAIERADIAFRVVKVPAGQHRVEMRYEPQSFRVGLLISIGAWAMVLLVVGVLSVRHVKRRVL